MIDRPRIFERGSTPITSIEGLSTSEGDSPSSLPAEEGCSVFSANESVSTDITDNYGWDGPSEQGIPAQPRSLSTPGLFFDDKERGVTDFGSPTSGSRSGTREDASDSLATPDDVSTRDSIPPSETTDSASAPEEEYDRKSNSLGLTRIWAQSPMGCCRGGSLGPHDRNQVRGISFSPVINTNFSNGRKSYGNGQRTRRSISTALGDVTGNVQFPTPTHSSLENRSELRRSLPASPADKSPYIRPTNTLSEQVMISLPSIQKFQPYVPKCHAGKSVSQRLREVLTAPLTKSEVEKSGMIYIFWYQGNFGHLKIGHTKDLDQRLRAWEKCGKPLDVHFPLLDDDKRPVQHIHRVEKLIHAELKDCRLREECSECNKTHIEWFCVSKDAAVNVVRKWVQWMRKQPYTCEIMNQSKPVWRLDSEETVGSLSDLCTPSTVPVSSTASRQHRHSIPRQKPLAKDYSNGNRRAASASF